MLRTNIKKQVEVSDREDRLSNLPEEIKAHILSFLSTEESVRSSVLSTRWQYIWSSVPILNFTYKDFGRGNFLNVVDRLLKGHSQHFPDKVLIDGDSFVNCSHMEAWICVAIKCNVREIRFSYFDDVQLHELHQNLFSCNVLVVLELCYVNIVLNFHMTSSCFSNLKLLALHSIKYKDESSAQNLISSCPVLEKLVILKEDGGNDNLRTLNVTSLSLKSFVLDYPMKYETTPVHLVLVAPALESLDIYDNFAAHEYVVRNLSSIISAKLSISTNDGSISTLVDYGRHLLGHLINGIFNVMFLRVSCDTMIYLTLGMEYSAGTSSNFVKQYNLPAFQNLTHLKFTVGFSRLEWKLVIEFLKRSPKLEVLTFQTSWSSQLLHNEILFFFEEQGTSLEHDVMPIFLLMHLKAIKFKGCINEDNVNWLRYLIKNAKVLEKLIVETYYGTLFRSSLKSLMINEEDVFKYPKGSLT